MFQVKKLIAHHTLSSAQLNPNHHQANKKVLDHLFVEMLGNNHSEFYYGTNIQRDFTSKYKIHIPYKQE